MPTEPKRDMTVTVSVRKPDGSFNEFAASIWKVEAEAFTVLYADPETGEAATRECQVLYARDDVPPSDIDFYCTSDQDEEITDAAPSDAGPSDSSDATVPGALEDPAEPGDATPEPTDPGPTDVTPTDAA